MGSIDSSLSVTTTVTQGATHSSGAISVTSDVAIVAVTLDGTGGFLSIDVLVGHWARSYVEFVWERDIILAPQGNATRAESAAIVTRFLETFG